MPANHTIQPSTSSPSFPHPTSSSTMHVVLLILICLTAGVSVGLSNEGEDGKLLQDRWMSVYLQNQRVGYAHFRTTKQKEDGKELFTSTVHQQLTVGRGASTLTFSIDHKIKENDDGKVIYFSRHMEQGPITQLTEGRYTNGKLHITIQSGGNSTEQTVNAPDTLGPWAIDRITGERGYDPGTEYSLPVFVIEAPSKKVTAEISIGPQRPKKIYEIEKWLYQVQINLSIMPGATTTEWIDNTGKTWISTTKLGPFTIELRTVPKHEALRPPQDTDIMLGAGIQPDRRITNPRDVKELLISIKNKVGSDNDLPQLPESHYQTVTRKNNALDVGLTTPDHDDYQAAYTAPYSGDKWNIYLQPTPWLETESQIIKKMANSISTDNQSPVEIAHTIEKFVHDEIEDKNFGMGFATALETAQQKAGDCTEHALLAAALLRAKGIPSRVVTGLAYGGPFAGQNVPKFYFHMWVEAWTGKWTPIDPALGGYDATHIALTQSDLLNHSDLMDISNAVGEFANHNMIYIKRYR